MALISLTPELQAAQAPIQNAAAAAQPTLPVGDALPAGQDLANPTAATPLGNAPSTPPPADNEPGSFQAKLAAAADQLGIKPGPGGWARSLVGAAQTALGTGLQDYANAKPAPNSGILGGIAAQQAAKANRIAVEKKAQTEEDKDRASIAHENVQTMYQQAQLHKLNDEANHEDVANGKAAIDNFTTHLSENGLRPAPIIAKDVTDSQVQNAIKNQSLDPSYNHIWPSGSFQPFDPKTGKPMVDKDGQPMLQKTYTVVGNVPETVLDDKMAKLITDNVAGVHFEAGQRLSGAQAGSLIQQAMNHQTTIRKIENDQEKADVDKLTLDQKKAQLIAVNNLGADFGRILAQADGDIESATRYMTGQHQIRKIVNGKPVMTPDPESVQFAKDHPQAYKDVMDAFGGAVEYAKIVDTQKKETEQARHDAAEEATKQQQEKDKQDKENAYQGDENAGTPEQFLASLKPAEADIVKSITSGHLDAGRMAYLLARNPGLVSAVVHYDPGFDNSKVAGYAKTVQDFTSGKVADSIQAGATAANHLRELYDLNTDVARIPGTAAHQRYQNKVDTVATELGRFYGNTTQEGIASYKDTLNSMFNRGAAIQEQIGSMNDKLENYRQQWQNAAPSDRYFPLMPEISQKAKQDMAYVKSGGKGPNGQQSPPLKPSMNAGVPHEIIIGGKVAGYSTDGLTMTKNPPPGARPVGTAVQ